MSPVTLRPVSEVDFNAFTEAFNRAYSDYYVPIDMTPPAFRTLMQRDDLDPAESVAAIDNGLIVGTGLLGIRGKTGWIGGMGVIPERRREGIGRQMMYYLLDRAHQRQLTHIDLEVIEANTGAYALYKSIGFDHYRYLLILERDPTDLPTEEPTYRVSERPPAVLLPYYADFHDVPNCWQRGLPSLEGLTPHAEGWCIFNPDDDSVIGYAMGWANEYGIRLVDIATHPQSDRTAVAKALLAHLHRQNSQAHGNSYNIAENDPALPAYEAIGYKTAFRQIEMRLVLT